MKRLVRLKESELYSIIKRIINEESTKYPEELIRRIVKSYDGRLLKDFRKEQSALYRYIIEKGEDYYKDLLKNMVKSSTRRSEQELEDEAKKYETKNDFKKNSPRHWNAAINKGPWKVDPVTGKEYNTLEFYNKITAHMKPMGSLKSRLVYVHEFRNENGEPVAAYVGLTYNSEIRYQQHVLGKGPTGTKYKDTPVTIFIRENPDLKHEYKELTGYLDESEAVNKEREWEQKYREDGWLLLNKMATGGLGGGGLRVTNDELKRTVDTAAEEGLTISQFQKKYASHSRLIYNRGLDKPPYNYLDGLSRVHSKRKTTDEVYAEAITYNSYDEMRLGNPRLYDKVSKRGLVPKVKEFYKQKQLDTSSSDSE